MGFINPDGYLPGRPHKFENTEGIKERVDPELKEVIRIIDRGDLGIPAHALKAAAFQYAAQCNPTNQEFMLCKKEEADPRRCLRYGDKVSDCAANFFKNVTDSCADVFTKFGQCLEHNTRRDYTFCRKQQLKFDRCLYEKLGYDKVYDATPADTKIKTDRPKPYNPHRFENYDYPKPFAADWSRPIKKVDDL